jgi:hypothetical protein
MRIKSIYPVCFSCIIIAWVETPSTAPYIGQGGRVYMEDPVGYGST